MKLTIDHVNCKIETLCKNIYPAGRKTYEKKIFFGFLFAVVFIYRYGIG